MNTYIAMHHHRHGVDAFLVRSESFPSEEQVVETCGIDYEPDRDEYIDISDVDLNNIPTVAEVKL